MALQYSRLYTILFKIRRSNSVTMDETVTSNSALEDYTDMEYLEIDDQHDGVGDDVDSNAEYDVDGGTTKIYYLTKSSKDKDVSKRGSFLCPCKGIKSSFRKPFL